MCLSWAKPAETGQILPTFEAVLRIRITLMLIRIVLFTLIRIRFQLFPLIRIRIQLPKMISIRIRNTALRYTHIHALPFPMKVDISEYHTRLAHHPANAGPDAELRCRGSGSWLAQRWIRSLWVRWTGPIYVKCVLGVGTRNRKDPDLTIIPYNTLSGLGWGWLVAAARL